MAIRQLDFLGENLNPYSIDVFLSYNKSHPNGVKG